jgi:hypothetical protein
MWLLLFEADATILLWWRRRKVNLNRFLYRLKETVLELNAHKAVLELVVPRIAERRRPFID